MTERDAVTRALAGPDVNARATSAGVAPCAPTPGSRMIDWGIARRASPTARGKVAPTTAPTLDRPRSPTRSAPHSATRSATWCHSGRPSESVELLDVAGAGVGGVDEHEQAGAVAPARRQERVDRVAAQERAHGEGVRERRPHPVRLEERGRVRARRRADVAALAVGDDEQPDVARMGAHRLERRRTVRAERLEERDLRLHADHVRGDGVDDARGRTAPPRRPRRAALRRPRRGAPSATGRPAGRAPPRAGCACARPRRPHGRRTASPGARPSRRQRYPAGGGDNRRGVEGRHGDLRRRPTDGGRHQQRLVGVGASTERALRRASAIPAAASTSAPPPLWQEPLAGDPCRR